MDTRKLFARIANSPVCWSALLAGLLVTTTQGQEASSPAIAPVRHASGQADEATAHPLDPALRYAEQLLKQMETNVVDYTATVIKRERIGNELKEHEFMFAKIRNRKVENGKVVTPFSVYLRFLKPESVKGREVIWVEGLNDNRIIAHETGLLGFKRFKLAPEGYLAMMGQRYPITTIGIVNLVEELIKRGQRDRQHPECEVKFYQNAKIDNGAYVCSLIEVSHPVHRDHFDFYRARIYVDKELGVPVHYAAWGWPDDPGGAPSLLEEYTYRNLKLNVGLTDKDFDPDNPEYAFP